MKVLILADGMGPPDARGIEIITEQLCKLAEKGIEITVVTTLDHHRKPSEFRKWRKRIEKKGLRLEIVDLSWLTKRNRYVALALSKILTFFKAVQLVFTLEPDIVHEYSSSPSLFLRTYLVALLGRAKSVHTIITYNDKYLSSTLWVKIGNLLDAIIVPSKSYARKYLKYVDQKKLKVISQGVDTKRYSNSKQDRKVFGIPGQKKTILFLGPPEKGKGLFLLLESSKQLLKTNPDAFFLFVFHRKLYKDEYTEAINRIRKTYSNKKTYNIIESIVDVPILMNSVDVVVLPQTTHHGTLVYPQTLLEAMASRKVVVVSSSPEIKEIVKDRKNGILFENGNSTDLANALSSALKSKKTMGNTARTEILEKHSLEKCTTKTHMLYKSLI